MFVSEISGGGRAKSGEEVDVSQWQVESANPLSETESGVCAFVYVCVGVCALSARFGALV